MNLEAKEMRMVILGLKSLLKDTENKLNTISEESDDYSYLINDISLVESMILSFSEEYESKCK
ncbi:MAG: hypothetical protein ACRBCS_05745 [Cellvibrionaceae bacterium]